MTKLTDTEAAALFGNRFLTERAPSTRSPRAACRPTDAMRLVGEDLNLEGDPQRNLATFVTTWMEPEAQRIIAENLHRNFIDHAEYPVSAEIEQRCVRMLADLFNAPGETTGCRTQGSSEAIMLGALSLKWKWKERRQADEPLDGPAQPRVRRGRARGVGEVLPLLRRRAPHRAAGREQVHDRARRRGAAPRREHDRRRGGAGHDVHRPHGRHRRDQRPAPRHQEGARAGHPAARRRRERRLRVALPLPRLEVGLPAGAGPLDQRLRPQVRTGLPRHRLAGLPGEGRPRRGPGVLRELPRQDRRHLHPELLDRRVDGAGAVLQLRPARSRRLHLRDEADAAERRGSWRSGCARAAASR